MRGWSPANIAQSSTFPRPILKTSRTSNESIRVAHPPSQLYITQAMSRLLPGLAALRGCGAAPLAPLARVRPTALAAQSAARLSTSSSPRPTIPSTRVLTQDTLRALWAKQPSSSPSPLASQGSMTQRLLQRAFSSSPIGRIRDHYYRSGGGGGRGGGGWQKPGWFAELRGRINRWNPLYVVYAIMAANIAVFLMWQYAISSYVSALCERVGGRGG